MSTAFPLSRHLLTSSRSNKRLDWHKYTYLNTCWLALIRQYYKKNTGSTSMPCLCISTFHVVIGRRHRQTVPTSLEKTFHKGDNGYNREIEVFTKSVVFKLWPFIDLTVVLWQISPNSYTDKYITKFHLVTFHTVFTRHFRILKHEIDNRIWLWCYYQKYIDLPKMCTESFRIPCMGYNTSWNNYTVDENTCNPIYN